MKKPTILSIMPILVFLGFYLGGSLLLGDFYKIPVTLAFAVASGFAIATMRGIPFTKRVEHFSAGAANKNIMLMVWIFILAGAFAQGAKQMGAIDAVVNLTLNILPGNMIIAGVFLASCFISLSIGTSVGTAVAITPLAAELAGRIGADVPFMVAVVVGGALFGDNLSFISDTTIAATQSMGCKMKDKFRVNSMIVVPPALLVFAVYLFMGKELNTHSFVGNVEWLKIIPYMLVLLTALTGMNVLLVLLMGIAATGVVGLCYGDSFFDWFGAMGNGIVGMGELIIMTLLAGGMLEAIRFNGGIDYITDHITRRINSKRGAELSIAAMVSMANLCTANNTIAIITTGAISKDISARFSLDPRKTASLLDTFSCMVQGIIPYGAQVMIATGLAGTSPMSIIPHLYYPFCMGIFAFIAILIRYPRRYS